MNHDVLVMSSCLQTIGQAMITDQYFDYCFLIDSVQEAETIKDTILSICESLGLSCHVRQNGINVSVRVT